MLNNYQLFLFKHTLPDGTYKYLEDAIKAGKENNVPFTINLISPEMVVCYWQPGMGKVAYNEYFKRWYEMQQVGLQGVME